jgi:hypothetical protein
MMLQMELQLLAVMIWEFLSHKKRPSFLRMAFKEQEKLEWHI